MLKKLDTETRTVWAPRISAGHTKDAAGYLYTGRHSLDKGTPVIEILYRGFFPAAWFYESYDEAVKNEVVKFPEAFEKGW